MVLYDKARALLHEAGWSPRPISPSLLQLREWTPEQAAEALGITPAVARELVMLSVVRRWSRKPLLLLRDDFLDLIGVRWALDGDTAKDYIERCDIVGVLPAQNRIRTLPKE